MNSFGFGGAAPLSLIPVEPEAVDVAAVAECPMPKAKGAAKAKRARLDDGTFKADDPSTTDKDEAWVEG